MRNRILRTLSLFLAALMLCLTALPASAADPPASAAAASMQLMKTTGTVNVTNSSGRSLSKRDNMLLYSGYRVETKAMSYAWINLDNTKLAKLDAVSKVELRKSGKKLELLLSSGHLFFNVTSPLEADETLNVRTSTMVVGIRGTCGWIKMLDRWSAEIYVLEGTVQCSVTDPVTGQVKDTKIEGGEKAVATAYPQDQEGDKCDIVQERFEPGAVDGFVLEELIQDPGLCGEIQEASGLDILGSLDGPENVQERLEQDQQEMQDKLDRVDEGLAGQEDNVSTDPVWGQEEDPAPTTPGSGGGVTEPDGPAGPSGPTAPDDPTDPEDPTVPDSPAARTYTMPQTAAQVKKYLDQYDEVTLLPGSAPSENKLTIDSDMTIRAGKTLTLSDGISVEIAEGRTLTIEGRVTGGDNLDNTLTVLEGAALEISGSGALKMRSIENHGTLMNNKAGKIVTESITTDSLFGSLGVIDGMVIQTGGKVEITDGTIAAETTHAVQADAGTFILNGGEIAASTPANGSAVLCGAGAALELKGGTITNNGDGYAILASGTPAITWENTVIRAKNPQVLSPENLIPDCTAQAGGGYYSLVKTQPEPAVTSGFCGESMTWEYSNGTLAIEGTGVMENYSSAVLPPWYDYRASITAVSIGKGVTGIGSSAFLDCGNLTGVYYGGSRERWNEIVIGDGNDSLLNAAIHCAEPDDDGANT